MFLKGSCFENRVVPGAGTLELKKCDALSVNEACRLVGSSNFCYGLGSGRVWGRAGSSSKLSGAGQGKPRTLSALSIAKAPRAADVSGLGV